MQRQIDELLIDLELEKKKSMLSNSDKKVIKSFVYFKGLRKVEK